MYVEVNFMLTPYSEDVCDAIISELGEIGYESFCYTDNGFSAYVMEDLYDEMALAELSIVEFFRENFEITYEVQRIEKQNWNKMWEDNFTPITVGDIQVRARFHPQNPNVKYDIIIEPKMSFGTGHHSTTALMLDSILRNKDRIEGKRVLDMGCGTAILAIMASKVGADSILGIDIDEWAYTNAFENIDNNLINNIDIKIGDASLLKDLDYFDVILANINRNILLEDMEYYVARLNKGGLLIMSGFYLQDLNMINEKAESLGLVFDKFCEENDWIAASFNK